MEKRVCMKRTFIFFVVCCLACLMKGEVTEVKAETYGDYEYIVLEDGTVSITNYNGICESTEETIELDIPLQIDGRKVTSIGDGAFASCNGLSSIEIPAGITSIGNNIFEGCENLKKITVSKDNPNFYSVDNYNVIIETSSKKLVVGCNNSKIPSGVLSIGDNAFQNCNEISQIEIPDSVTSIGNSIFEGCNNLKTITVSSNNPQYYSVDSYNVIIETSSKKLVVGCNNSKIPSGVLSIGDNAFQNCNEISQIEIPDSVITIGESAFRYCSGLSQITIPNSVTEIGGMAFYGCSGLSQVTISNSVTSIGSFAFYGCSRLSQITIPDSVKSIGKGAFAYCIKLTEFIIPNSVTSIEDEIFSNCKSLKQITIPNGVTSIGGSAFFFCKGLNQIIIPSSVISIGRSAFSYCSGLTEITIPNSVTSIGMNAFSYCSGLKQVTIPSSVMGFGQNVFFHCPDDMIINTEAGSSAEQYATENGYNVKVVGDETQKNPSNNDNQTNPSNNSSSSGTPAKKGSVLKISSLQYKVISDNASNPTVTYTGTTNKTATTIKVPDTVTVNDITYKVVSIADNALSGNKKVTKVIIGKNVTSIGKNAFKNCTKLKTVEAKSTTLNKIGANAFNGDKKLTKITLKTTKLTKNSIGKNALKGTNKKLVIKVPKSKVKNYKKYFKNKGNTSVTIKK